MKKYRVHILYILAIICFSVFSMAQYRKSRYLGWKMEGMIGETQKIQVELNEANQKAKANAEDAMKNAAEALIEKNRAEIEKEKARKAIEAYEKLRKKCGN